MPYPLLFPPFHLSQFPQPFTTTRPDRFSMLARIVLPPCCRAECVHVHLYVWSPLPTGCTVAHPIDRPWVAPVATTLLHYLRTHGLQPLPRLLHCQSQRTTPGLGGDPIHPPCPLSLLHCGAPGAGACNALSFRAAALVLWGGLVTLGFAFPVHSHIISSPAEHLSQPKTLRIIHQRGDDGSGMLAQGVQRPRELLQGYVHLLHETDVAARRVS